jgi:hypothetical protein
MRERDAGFMLAQFVLLNIENHQVTIITNAHKKRCIFAYLLLNILENY